MSGILRLAIATVLHPPPLADPAPLPRLETAQMPPAPRCEQRQSSTVGTSVALVAIAPLAETKTRGRVMENGLRDATEKLATLLNKQYRRDGA